MSTIKKAEASQLKNVAPIELKSTITSLDLVKQINLFRSNEGNRAELLHKSLLAIIRDEFDDEITEQNILPSEYVDSTGRRLPMFELTLSQAKQVLVRESKFVRKATIAYIEKLENALKKPQLPDFSNPIEAARAWADAKEAEQIALSQASEALEQIEAAKPKIELYDMAMSSEDAIDMKTVATTLSLGIGRNSLFKLLREKQVLDAYNRPYQSMVNRGYFKTIETPYERQNGDVHISIKTVVLQKGVEYIKKLIAKSKSNK